MGNTIARNRTSERVKSMEVSNGATASILASSGNYVIVIDDIECASYDRCTIQIRNVDNSSTPIFKVFGSLFLPPGESVTTSGLAADSKWVQVGDDISLSASSGAIKSISTTGLKRLCIIARDSASNTQTFPIGDCIVFFQETV